MVTDWRWRIVRSWMLLGIWTPERECDGSLRQPMREMGAMLMVPIVGALAVALIGWLAVVIARAQ